MDRRQLLKGVGAGSAAALGGCLENAWNPLRFAIFQTDILTTLAEMKGKDKFHAAKVARGYVKEAFAPVVAATDYTHVEVNIVRRPVDIDTDGTHVVIRATEWDEMVDQSDWAPHGNILLDTGSSTAVDDGIAGLAFLFDGIAGCDPGDQESNASIVQEAERLLELEPGKVRKEIPIIEGGNVQPTERWLPYFTAKVVAHELGHNVCGPHITGNAWRRNVPEHMLSGQKEDDTLYVSNMMAFYIFLYGGLTNLCGKEIPKLKYKEVDSDEDGRVDKVIWKEDLTILTHFSACTIAAIAEAEEDAD